LKTLLHWTGISLIGALLIFSLPTSSGSDVIYQDQVAVIAYHHIDDHVNGNVTITAELFKNQLLDLLNRGFHFITLQQFKQFLSGGPVPPNAVLVTFDDGYKSFYTHAFPVLLQLNIPAVNFVITKDLDYPLETSIPSLSREEIRDMAAKSPLFDFGCHSNSLHTKNSAGDPLLTSRLVTDGQEETEEQYERRIAGDTRVCIGRLQELYPHPVDVYAYPFGAYDNASIQILKKAGIRYAFTTRSEMVTRDTDPMEIPRINAGSPFIRSYSLHNLILRKIIGAQCSDIRIPLQLAIKHLGGKMTVGKNGDLQIVYRNVQWTVQPDRKTAVTENASLVFIEPIEVEKGRLTIRKDDLERLLNIQIYFNPNTGQYFSRETPKAPL
jgi:peptidoglycan/xylan/chitin deacetylase (PgdA/CDA1 family)